MKARSQSSIQKPSPDNLAERLCRSLAFHVVETEVTLSVSEGNLSELCDECALARRLIAEAGFNIDDLYPVSERPTATLEDEMDPQLLAELRSGRRIQ